MAPQLDNEVLEDKLLLLEAARGWSPRTISRLESLLRSGSDDALFRVDPLRYGAEHKLDEVEAIDLFLHAVKVGLFDLTWHVLCAFCGHVVERLSELSTLHRHYRCHFCSALNDGVLDDLVQAAFTVSPKVRSISFHRPHELPIGDYYLHFHFARGVTFASGATLQQMAERITRFMRWLEPGESVTVETEVAPGRLAAKDLQHRASVALFLTAATQEREELSVTLRDGVFTVAGRELAPRRVAQTLAHFEYDATAELASARVRMEFHNATEARCPLWVLHLPAAFESSPVRFEPFLSGKRLLTTQTFRTLFRAETFGADEGLAVRDMTFLFTDLKDSTALYGRVGDLNAFFLVRQHFDALARSITNHRGAIVKTIGDAVMASFSTPADGVRAALDMLAAMSRFNETVEEPIALKIGLHRGPSIAVTLNERIDYFGQSVNIAARIQGVAEADEICLGQTVFDEPDVRGLIENAVVRADEVVLKGVTGKVPVWKVTR